MSTRCCVKVMRDFENDRKEIVTLYHHHDGYPSGVGFDLLKRSEKWKNGNYPWDIDTIVNSLIKDDKDEYEYTAYNHSDIEYMYIINCNKKTIKCYECVWVYEDKYGRTVNINVMSKEVKIEDKEK